jgi:hypothetical protein
MASLRLRARVTARNIQATESDWQLSGAFTHYVHACEILSIG